MNSGFPQRAKALKILAFQYVGDGTHTVSEDFRSAKTAVELRRSLELSDVH